MPSRHPRARGAISRRRPGRLEKEDVARKMIGRLDRDDPARRGHRRPRKRPAHRRPRLALGLLRQPARLRGCPRRRSPPHRQRQSACLCKGLRCDRRDPSDRRDAPACLRLVQVPNDGWGATRTMGELAGAVALLSAAARSCRRSEPRPGRRAPAECRSRKRRSRESAGRRRTCARTGRR
jgi:hypothetical protein